MLFNPSLESFAHIATILGMVSVWVALVALQSSRKSFHHAVIVSCTNRFQQLSIKLRDTPLLNETVHQYLDLCNEELFFFESNYLPQPIIDEWVDGMLGYIQLRRYDDSLFSMSTDTTEIIIDPSPPLSSEQHQLLKGYPRLNHAFRLSPEAEHTVKQVYRQYGVDAARAQMVLTVLDNIHTYKKQPFLQHLRRARAEVW